MKGNVIDGARAAGARRDRHAVAIGMLGVRAPFGNVNAGDLTGVDPISGEFERGTGANVHAERVDVEIPRALHVIGQNEIVLDVLKGHGGASEEE